MEWKTECHDVGQIFENIAFVPVQELSKIELFIGHVVLCMQTLSDMKMYYLYYFIMLCQLAKLHRILKLRVKQNALTLDNILAHICVRTILLLP